MPDGENHSEKVALLFEECVEISDLSERSDYLKTACGDNADLRHEVEALLQAHDLSGPFLSGGVPPRPVDNRQGEDPDGIDLKPGDTVGPYRLMGLIGEGSTSTVFLAEQEQPVRRWVALKIVKAGMDTRRVILRFGLERQALALMDHPGIAKLLDAGATPSGRPFFVMELVSGESITRFCNEHKMTIPQRLKLFEQICHAVSHAHQKGIIHRDLKPDNILVSYKNGEVNLKIVDFGIAKVLRTWGLENSTRTSLLPFLGTPAYMSPEQVLLSSPDLDTRTDIYSLGALLYELLVGQPPFDPRELVEAGLEEMCRIIRTAEPTSPSERYSRLPEAEQQEIALARGTTPSELHRMLSGDLDWITLKALEKSREQRYATTNSLANDIERHLEHRPVSAAAHTFRYRASKFLQRKRKLVIAGGALAALLLVATLLIFVMAIKAGINAREARESEKLAMHAQQQSHNAMVAMHVSSGLGAAEDRHPDRAVLWFANAARASGPEGANYEINARRAMSWMSQVPIPVCAFKLSASLQTLEFSADSRFLLAIDIERNGEIWDVVRQEPLAWKPFPDKIIAAVWHPSGSSLAIATDDGEVQILDVNRRMVEHSLPISPVPETIGFTPDGNRLIIGSDRLQVYDLHQRKLWQETPPLSTAVAGIVFSPQSDRLATIGLDGYSRIFDLNKGTLREMGLKFPHRPAIRTETCPSKSNYREDFLEMPRLSAPALIGDGNCFLTRTGPYEVTCWDMPSGNVVTQFQDVCCSCRFVTSHEAGLIACGIQGGKAGIWKSATEEQVQLLPSQGACILDMAFNRDGSSLITAEASGMARIWNVQEALEQQSPMHHCTDVDKVAFAPNGMLVATGQSDGLVRVWNVFEPVPDEHSEQRFNIPTQVVVDPAGKRFVLTREPGWQAGPGSCIRRLDLFSMEEGGPPHAAIDLEGCISTAAFSTDSASLAVGIACLGNGGAGQVHIFTTADLSAAPVSLPLQILPANLAWNPDGSRMAVIGEAGEILMIDVAGEQTRSLMGSGRADHAHVNPLVAFTADGKALVSLGRDGIIRVWDAATGELRHAPIKSGSEGFWSFTLSPDNLHMATTTTDGEVRIWDLQKGIPLASTLQHPRWVYRCRFSPDQQKLITASHDGKVRIWEWSSGTLLNGLLTHPNEVYDAAFTPDNRWVITACRDGNIRIWDPESGQIMAPPIKVGQQAFNIEITTNGHYALVGTLGDEFYILSLENFHEALPLDAEDLCLVGEVVSACTVENGVLRDLTTGEWLERYARIQALHPEALESGQAYVIRKLTFDKKNIFISVEDRTPDPSTEEQGPLATGVIEPDNTNTCAATAGCTQSCGECQFPKVIKAG